MLFFPELHCHTPPPPSLTSKLQSPPPRGTPGLLSATGYALIAGAAALVYFVADDSTASLVGQALGAAALGGGGVAALVGAGLLSDLQRLD